MTEAFRPGFPSSRSHALVSRWATREALRTSSTRCSSEPPFGSENKNTSLFDPHPPLRGTLSHERDILKSFPLPLGEGAAKRRVRVEVATLLDLFVRVPVDQVAIFA